MAQEKIDKELVFVRHACSWGNEEDRQDAPAYLADDPPLSPKGERQALLLTNRFEKGSIDAIISSPLSRAVGTAYPTAVKLGKKIELLGQLMETDTKLGGSDETALAPYRDRLILPYEKVFLGEDTEEKRAARAAFCVRTILGRYPDAKRLMIVSHGTFLKYVYEAVLGLPNMSTFCWSNDNCSITRIILYKNHIPKLKAANDRTHLFAAEPEYFTFKGEDF